MNDSHLIQQTSFASLITPVSVETFFSEYWEKKPLLIQRHNADYYRFLFSVKDLEHILAFSRFKSGELFLNRNSQLLEKTVLNSDGTVNLSQIYGAYEQGYTIVLDNLRLFHRPATLLCQQLEGVFTHPVGINTYLTPKGTQGFKAHFDTMDNFLLQIEGRKHWHVYGEYVRYPMQGYGEQLGEDQLPEMLIDVILEPGDLLYFPRGFVHQGVTMDEFSLHITVGVEGYSWLELISQSLAKILDTDERFRRFLPAGLLTCSPTDDDEHLFRELIQTALEQLNMNEGVDALADLLMHQPSPSTSGYLRPSVQIKEIDETTRFYKRHELLYRYIFRNSQAILQFSGGSIRGSAKMASALRFIAHVQKPFALGDIPGMITRNEKLQLLKRLLHEQLLVIES